ncbi:MAG: N-acetyl-gamma-glutamyl-phosphate reductase [Atopococcus tabaci]|uniref:N-acetyl-gamma-glutamyl-phosphate reductase n=1 Tax=Atopococcus tabaci TaxID=269774 RepID=A0AA43ZRZ5_9LACT|nr:N-acetyl-gamma-glutamyl-phosphate reductase [Atopococcus tabaci]
MKVSIIGASGYTGSELMRILMNHPQVELAHLTARSLAGEIIAEHFPIFTGYLENKTFVEMDLDQIKKDSDVVFICLPHGHSMSMAKELLGSVKVIDMGADFRIKDINTYEKTYQVDQLAPELVDQAVYGLTEFYREDIQNAELIANPGCFSTNALLALMPLVKNNLIDPQSIIFDAKTGISGAGRSANVDNLLAELGNSFKVYNPLGHRHIPEIEQELNFQSSDPTMIQFTPQLLPTERGIYSSIYANASQETSTEALHDLYKDFYAGEKFIHILAPGQFPNLKAVKGSNHCHLQIQFDERTKRILVFSSLDNLMKGASGQAVQNMNLMFNFEESLGLESSGLMP